MTFKPWIVTCIAIFAATPAWAQSSSTRPLNLNLPLQFTGPAAASTSHGKTKSALPSQPPKQVARAGDTRNTDMQPPTGIQPACNNKAYKSPRVFGNVGLGAFSGSGIEGNYQVGRVSVAKPLGSCSHPSGGIIFSFGFGRTSINGPSWPR